MNIQQEKKHLRHSMKMLLDHHKKKYQQNFIEEKQANNLLLNSLFFQEASSVLAYAATENELSVDEIMNKALYYNKIVAVPKCNPINYTMDFFQLSPSTSLENQLIPRTYGIREPVAPLPPLKKLKDKTLILIPGLAFSIEGKRLGQGKGFYDRYLEKILNQYHRKSLILMGVCRSLQLIKKIPTENTDILLDYILTPTKIYSCKQLDKQLNN